MGIYWRVCKLMMVLKAISQSLTLTRGAPYDYAAHRTYFSLDTRHLL